MDVDEKLGLLQNVKAENWCDKDGIHDLPRLSSGNGISVVLESSQIKGKCKTLTLILNVVLTLM
jgi:hypothetical protein